MTFNYAEYLRNDKMPHIWCPGCGNGVVTKSLIRAIDTVGYKKDETVVVSGIGCSGRISGYLDFNTLHTTHGRPLTFATGIKLANPKLNVIVVSGDGDSTAIGGNHFIHACRRNIDMTLVIFNNYIYGMTGGQHSPTTPTGSYSTTTAYRNVDPPFDISKLAIGAGATFVARESTYNIFSLDKLLVEAFKHKGFSVVEVIVGCPVYYGRKNGFKSAFSLLEWQRRSAVRADRAQSMKPEELEGKFTTGILHRREAPEYIERYYALIESFDRSVEKLNMESSNG
ncbi:MAG TPA: 2-oxoacid:ferredoxin oxidoreductase subunit beta [Thermodesulfobacteriota bacterium]|nr:2-oxoacid:ferredoxin oxidoreductase subunit beta [Thermodesulfobacteriota bacterium]